MIALIPSLVTFLLVSPVTNATVPACVFDNVVAFGASVTHGTAAFPGYGALVSGLERWGVAAGTYQYAKDAPPFYRPYGRSPVRYLVKHYAGKPGLNKINYISRWRTNRPEHLGSAQATALMRGSLRDTYAAASLVVGVDGFYWDAIKNTCGTELDRTITDLIFTGRDAGKVLILGNVPAEDPRTVRVDGARLPYDMWGPPNIDCAARINALLERHCTPANRCYIADLRKVVEDLLAGKKLALFDGTSYGLYGMRPDGLHLSDKGTRYMAQLMIKALERHPPTCR